MATRLGYSVQTVEHADEGGFCTDLDALSASLQQHPRAMVVLGSPNNPTGHATPLERIRALAEQFPRAGIVVDAVYAPLTDPVWMLPSRVDNVCAVGSFSSQLGLPGVRIGFVVGDASPALAATPGLNPSAVRAARVALQARPIAGDIERSVGGTCTRGRSGPAGRAAAPTGRSSWSR